MKPSVAILRLDEPARFNPDQLEKLCTELGEVRAESEVADALGVIGKLLQDVENLDQGQHPHGLGQPVRHLIAASDRIGMATLARAARNVEMAQASGDAVALSATLARLQRVGERSILAIWDLEDLSG
ncbi:hypothetical protein QTA57_04435 [Fontisubflavum oceani]|uniref:hypothetical protein n=1 Tax=Fontisubflavum oceani TaxID=2978973 RepID=UPI0025B5CBA2|nr:hypothetical protein [Fontisubflavum oceani]WJY22390.1 hypothetical protein QTA57_04435 [Fontisubflavum oceani]